MRSWILGLLAAIFLHLLVLTFGGIFFLKDDEEVAAKSVEAVDIVTPDDPEDDD